MDTKKTKVKYDKNKKYWTANTESKSFYLLLKISGIGSNFFIFPISKILFKNKFISYLNQNDGKGESFSYNEIWLFNFSL